MSANSVVSFGTVCIRCFISQLVLKLIFPTTASGVDGRVVVWTIG